MKIKIKPLSINAAYRPFEGRVIKSVAYRDYEKELWYKLPNKSIPQGKLLLDVKVGYSSARSDIDNFLKPFVDILQKKYVFNDNMIYKLIVEKKIVKKGNEYIDYKISEY